MDDPGERRESGFVWTGWWRAVPRPVRLAIVAVIGVAIVLAGVAMLALPGPGIPTIFLGLVVLGTEFAWARRMRQDGEHRVRRWWRRGRARWRLVSVRRQPD